MKLKLCFICFVLFVSSSFAAYEEVLLDFNDLASLSENAKNYGDVELKYLALDNWRVRLDDSSDFVKNRHNTYLKIVNAKLYPSRSEGKVLGVHLQFPSYNQNSTATITPPSALKVRPYALIRSEGGSSAPDYYQQNKFGSVSHQGLSRGALTNVQIIKKIKAVVSGRNFPYAFYISLRNEKDITRKYFLGFLNFIGWNEMTWNNPNYLEEIRTRDYIKRTSIYPRVMPFFAFDSFSIYRSPDQVGGGSIFYLQDIAVEYDKAFNAGEVTDGIEDKKEWSRVFNVENDYYTKKIEKYIQIEKDERNRANMLNGIQQNGANSSSEPSPTEGKTAP